MLRIVTTVLVVVVLGGALAVRFSFIRKSLPYCEHIDERTWTRIALGMTRTGNLNPHRFTKPSVMVYLVTAGLGLGLVRAASKGEADHPNDLGKDALPHYRLPQAIEVSKRIFATASVAALGMAGACAWMLRRERKLLVLVPLIGSISATYFYESWFYINVDIIGSFFVLATITNLLVEHGRNPTGAKSLKLAIMQGLLCGFTIGCKYNLFPILIPYLVYCSLFVRDRLVSRATLFIVLTIVGFVLSTPYALLSMNEFLGGAAVEANHYATAHLGTWTSPGVAMLANYLGDFARSYGLTVLALALLGLYASFRKNFRLALVTFSFPFVFLAYMSSQRVFFARNGTPLHVFVALAAGIGVAELGWLLWRWSFSRVMSRRPRWMGRALVVVPLLGVTLLGPPWTSIAAAYSRKVESRNDAARWLLRRTPAGSALIIDRDLLMETSALEEKLSVTTFDGSRIRNVRRMLRALEDRVTFFLLPPRNGDLVKELEAQGARVVYTAGVAELYGRFGAAEGNPKLVVLRLKPRASAP